MSLHARGFAMVWLAVLALLALPGEGAAAERPTAPGVYVEETAVGSPAIQPVATSITAFIGRAAKGPVNQPTAVRSFGEFERTFGGLHASAPMTYAVRCFFENGGGHALIVRLLRPELPPLAPSILQPPGLNALPPRPGPLESIGRPLDNATLIGDRAAKSGLYALEKADLFNLLCIPPDRHGGDTAPAVYQEALRYCVERRAFLLVDPPAAWSAGKSAAEAAAAARAGLEDLGLSGPEARNAALYFPRLRVSDPLRSGQEVLLAPSGVVAGIFARMDLQVGVWKAPASSGSDLRGVQGPEVEITASHQDQLNPLGINCLRKFPGRGLVVWGSRTLDSTGSEWRYIPTRRLALHLQESIARGLEWAVYEPNDETLWATLRARVESFLNGLWRQGAFQGRQPQDAYFVQCGRETMTNADIERGVAILLIGYAARRPAEFLTFSHAQNCAQLRR